MQYSIRIADQLGAHLKSLRRLRGMTQAGLGDILGLGQGRIAQIEAAPGLVSMEQIIRILAALDASLQLNISEPSSSTGRQSAASARKRTVGKPTSSHSARIPSGKGAW